MSSTDDMRGQILEDPDELATDDGTHHLSVRNGAQGELLVSHEEQQQALAWANHQLTVCLQMIRESALKKAATDVVSQPEIIAGIAQVHAAFETVLDRLQKIIGNFVVPLAMDHATGDPLFHPQNTGDLARRLGDARDHIRLLQGAATVPVKTASVEQNEVIIAPNDDLIRFFQNALFQEGFFENPGNVARVFNILDTYFRAVIGSTKLGVASTVHHTSQQIGHLHGTATLLDRQAKADHMMADEGETPQHDPDTLERWYQLLSEIELVLAESLFRLQKLYGENVKWLRNEVQLDDLLKTLHHYSRENMELQKRRDAKRLSDSRSSEREGSLIKRVFTKPEPQDPMSYAMIQQRLMQLSEMASQLKTLITAKRLDPQK